MNNTETSEITACRPCPAFSRLHEYNVVALGGGTGLPVVLRGLKNRLFPSSKGNYDRKRLTAVVTVTDDGGSSGRLRREFRILPPGDIRNCLAALSDNDLLSSDIFQYRFRKGNGLAGHSLGNLVLTALADLKGNFTEAINWCSQIMNVRGQVLPLTPISVTLVAKFIDGALIRGETAIVKHRGRIRYVFLTPPYSEALPAAVDAIEKADAIVMGPGSLYTSIIPNLLIADVVDAIRNSQARKIYVCNHMTEPGETDGYSASDHVRTILEHTEYGFLQYVVLNNGNVSSELYRTYERRGCSPVRNDMEEIKELGVTAIVADVISEEGGKIRHDEDKLGRILMELISSREAGAHRRERGRGMNARSVR
jgi:uncharacterized cofD-like protein